MNLDMKNIVKQYRYETVCVVLAMVILLAFWPSSKLGSEAKAKTEDLQKLNNRLKESRKRLATSAMIEEYGKKAQLLSGEAEQFAQLLKEKNLRPFLVDDLFTDSPAPAASLRFRDEYKQSIDKLLSDTLRAGWPAEDESAEGGSRSLSEIGIYAQRDVFSIGEWESLSDLPSNEDCWFAQLDFWIQHDLAEVFEELNQASAQQRGQKPSVENAAVKRIISIDVDPYYYVGLEKQADQVVPTPGAVPFQPGGPRPGAVPSLEERMGFGGLPPAGLYQPLPAANAPRTTSAAKRRRAKTQKRQEKPFTGRFCDKREEVLHFSFSVVVDSRRVNELLAALSRKNLYTILNMSLSRADVEIDARKFPEFDSSTKSFDPYSDAEAGLIYGPDPIVRLDVDVEALFVKDFYDQYMPQYIKQTLAAENDQAKQQREALIQALKDAEAVAKKKKQAADRKKAAVNKRKANK